MSIYKTVFITEAENPAVSGEKIFSVSGDVALTTAFSSLDEAVSAVSSAAANAIIKVAGSQTESYMVVNEGVVNSNVTITAVDFDGGDVMIGGENLVIADSGIAVAAQAALIADLNDITAGNGKVFVAVENAPADASTLFIGAGAAGTVAGVDAAVIYGSNMDEFAAGVNSMYNSPVEAAAAATEVAAGGNVYFDKNTSGSYVFKAGSVAHNELSKWDMTYAVTIEGGAKLVAGRNNAAAIAANTPQTSHIKSTLTLAGTADNKAVLNFLSDTRQDASLAILYNGKLVATHAEISVADLGFTGNATITDCTVYVDGVVAFGKNNWYKQTMTNTEMNVRGHNRHNENTYFSTEGVILNNLTMTNSSIKVDDSDAAATTEVVKIKKLTMASGSSVTTEGALEINGTITADSTCSLTANAVTFGTSGKIEFTLLEGFTSGKLIDITGDAGLAEDMLSKITLKGKEGFAAIKEGDIYVYAGKAQVDFNFDENDKNTLEGEVVAKTIDIANTKELAVTGEINAIDDANITNSKVEGAAEGVLNGGYDDNGKELAAKITAGKNIVMQNDGHANVELDAKNIVIANNSTNTLTGTVGTADTESVVIGAGSISADGEIVAGADLVGGIENATITAGEIEIADQEVTDTELNGKVAITGDSEFKGAVKNDTVTKVTNGATLTIAEDAAFNGQFLAAGNDSYFGFGNSDTNPAGTIDIYGNVKVQQTNADANGVVNVKDGAVLNSPELCVENGGIADAESGVLNIENGGQVNTASMRVFAGGEVNVAGTLSGNQPDYPTGGSYVTINVWDKGSINVNQGGQILVDDSMNVGADGSLSVNGATLDVKGTLTNDGTVNVSGESTLNIATLSGSSIDLLDGAIIKDSTVGGNAFIAGNVTFRGDNTFAMISDFGTLTDYYGTTAPMAWTVEAGASLTLTTAARYGLGYGDNVVINGNIAADGAAAARATLNDDNADNDVKQSLFMHGLVAQESSGWNCDSSFVVNNAYVTIGSNNSFGNKPGNYGGTYTFNFNNSVVTSSRITFYEALSQTEFTFADSDVLTGTFMTRDADSVFTLDNTKLLSTTATNGNDEGNYNAGTLNVVNGSELTYTAKLSNEGGTINITDSVFNANGGIANSGTVNVSGESTLNIASLSGNRLKITDGATITESNINLSKTDIELVSGTINFAGKNTISGGMLSAGYYNDEKDLTVNITGDFSASNLVAWGGPETKTVVNIGSKDAETTQYKGGQIGTFYGDTTLNVTNADVVYEYMFIQGNLNVSDSTLALNGHDTYFRTGSADHSIVIDNTTWTTGANTYLGAYGSTTSGGNAVVTVKGGSTINAGNLVLASTQGRNHVVSLTVDSSTINATTKFDVGAGTSVVLNDATLNAGDFVNNGAITLNVTDEKLAAITTEAYTIINQTGDGAALDLKVNYNGAAYGVGESITIGNVVYNITNGDGNDIAIKAASKILTVNSAYTEDTPGFGFSKFNNFEDALQAASSEATAIKLESDVTVASEIGYYNLPADLSIIADEHVTLDMAGASFYPMGKKTLVVGENVAIANMGQMIAYESRVILDGDFAGSHLWTFGWNGNAENGATGLTINETSKVTVATQLEFRGGDVTINGNIADTAAALGDADQIQLLGTTYGSWGGASGYATKVNLNNTYIKLAQNTIGGAATKFEDGSSAIVTMDNSIYETAAEGAFNVASTGLVKAENGSIIYINSGVRASNAGTINITDSTFESKSAFTNTGYFKIGENATATVSSIVIDGNGMLDVWGQEGKVATFNAGSITAKGENSGFYAYCGDINVDGTIETQGNFSIYGSTLKADTFKNVSAGYQQEFTDVDLDVTNFVNGLNSSTKYATIGGNSKVQIDNLSGYFALRLADGTTLKGGTNIVGTTSVRALGDVTFGETATDVVHIDSFDNNNAAGNTMTVNGTLDISSTGKGFSTYWLGVNGNADTTTLTGAGTINSNTAAILQYGKIVVDKDLTINVTDQYAADLRFTLTDLTIKGKINSIGSNNKLNAIQTSTVTVTGENAALDIDSYLLVGYQTYKGSNDTVNTYKSTLNVNDGAKLAVDGMTYINLESQVNVNNATYDAADITNYGNINLAGANFTADSVSGSGTFTIGSSVDAEGNAIATNLQIGNLAQDVKANENGTNPIELTGNINTANKFRVYGDATLDSFNVNAGFTGQVVSAVGQVLTYGDTVISGNSTISVNYFQATSGVVLEAGSTINAANMNLYDKEVDSDFVVNGTVNACTLILVNDYYNTGSGSEMFVAKDGVVNGLTQNGNGRFDIQAGNMTVQGYVNGTWEAGGGTAFVGNSGLDAKLVVDGTYASEDSNNGKFVNAGTQNLIVGTYGVVEVINGATFNWNSTVTNNGTITVDADSTFVAGNIVNTGRFNSSKDGEMIIDRDWNFAGNITSTELTILRDFTLTVGSINVTNLNLAIGSNLNVASKSVVASVTVTGTLIPENAAYTLVTSGWQNIVDANGNELQIRYDANNDGTIDASELFTVGVKGAGDYVFDVIENNGDKSLYLYKDDAPVAGLYIDANLPESGTVVTDNGATYTIGVNAFHSIDEALASDTFQNDPNAAAAVTSIYLGDGDHINDIADTFTNIKNIYVEKDANVIDNNAATFNNDVVIGNDGHLEADLTVYGKLSFTNTASDTLLGSYEADSIEGINTGAMAGSYTAIEDIVINNNSGTIGGDKGETSFTADYVAINGGDASKVTVEAGILELTNTNTFGLEADSDILSGSDDIWNPVGGGNILLNGSANMSIDGDNDAIGATIDSIDHTGTVTFNGEQTYTGDIAANKFVVAEGSDVKVNSTQFDFNELEVAGDLTVDFTASGAYTDAGAVSGNGYINAAHAGNWIINDTVSRDFSGFAGNIAMTEAGAGIVMGKGDATDADVADAKRSYFADGSTVTAAAGQSLALAGNGITTGINFAGAGTINVGDVDAASALVDSASFTQTLTGTNTGFTGDVNVGEGATLNLNTQINAAAFNLDATGTEATGADDATSMVINSAMTLAGTITGDANDVVDAKADTTLTAEAALDNFSGEVKVNANTLTLDGVNSTAAVFTGTGTIDANANQTLTADGAINDFTGTVDIGTSKLTLDGTNNTDAIFKSESTSARLILNADQTFNATGALDQLENQIALGGNDLTLNGENTFSSGITGTTDSKLNLNADLTLDRSGMALYNYEGTVNVNDNTLTVTGTENTKAIFTGTADAEINWYAGIMSTDGALDAFNGSINSELELSLNGVNDTTATFTTAKTVNIGAHNTFSTDGAIDNVTGTIQLWGNTLTLEGENTISAELKSNSTTAVLDADATQVFTGDVSGFSGTYDIAAGASVTLSGTIADVINAKGDTLNLTNAGTDVTVNAAANAALINLNFGANNVTLGAGDGDDFTNVNGSGNIVDFGADQDFGTVSADTIFVTGSEDALTIATLTSDINITLDAMQSDDKADVTVSGVFTGEITVKVEDGNVVGKEYKLVKNSAFTADSSIIITVKNAETGTYSNEQALVVDQLVVIDGKAYLLQLKDETLVLSRMHGFSNFVVIDGDWSSKVPYQAVMDGNIERIIGYDAAKDLADAVSYIKGYDTGINANAGTNTGDATMELLSGSYKLSTGTLMTDENGVTQLILKGRDGENVVISGTLRGSDGSAAADGSSTELVLENIRTTGYVFAGGELTIKNSASIKTGGNAIAAGIANEDSTAAAVMAQASKLTINGGYFNTNVLTGGSIAFGGDVTVTGSTTVVIDNQNDEALTITGNIFGGSYAAQGTVTQSGDAYVFINAENATTLRGNIYVSGFNSASGTLNMSGNSYVTFSGDASMLGFTGTVSAIQSAKDEIATFENFDGKFNGTLSGFDSIVISGSTELSFARRQTLTANTSMIFNINAATGSDAMYTVRDANAWEFAKTINVNVDNVGVGTYVLVAGYEGGFDDFTITLNGMATQNAIIGNYSYTVAESSTSGKLYLQVKDITNGLSTGAGVTNLDSVSIGSGSGNALTFGLGSEEVITSGNTTINGKVNAPYGQAEVFTVADGKTTVNGDFGLGNGNDKLDVQVNAEMEINGDFTLGNGNNDVVIGADAELTVNGDAMLGGGSAKNIVTLKKGAIMNVTDFSTGTTGSGSALIMDVDAILNNTEGYGNKPIIEVEGVASLTTDIAGAKALVNALDWSAAATNSSQYTIDDVEAVLGTATQIAGAGTAGDTTDDIWASLSKIDNQLVVAWGRSEVEVGAALDAFNAQTDLTFGQAVVATATSLGDSDTANDFSKKNHGTLA